MSEFKEKIKGSTILKVIIWAVVILIPLLYSFFYLKAFWDPYGNLKDVKVGIVNLDEGVDGENQGEELKNKLLEKDSLKFESVNPEDSNTSLANQEYYAMITIPKDFTQNLKNAENADRKVTTITYSPNKKSNYLASQIIKSAVNTIEKELRAEISQTVVGTLTDKLNDVPDKMEEISDGISQVQDGTSNLVTSYESFDNGVDSAYEGSKNLDSGINELNVGIDQIYSGTQALASGTSSIDTLISSVNTLSTNYSKLDEGLQQYVSGVNASNTQVTSLVTDLLTYEQTGDTQKLTSAITKANTLAQNSQNTDTKEIGAQLTSSSRKINSGIQTLNSKVSELHKLSDGAKDLQTGIASLEQGGIKLKTGSTQLTEGLQILSSSSKQVKDGVNTLNNGVTTLKTSIDTGITDTKDELTKLDGLDQYTANPVEVEEKAYGEIDAYGVGFAPYFISLSLWVGALMAFVVLYYDQENRFKLFGKNAERKILRTVLYGLLAVAQGLSLGFLLKLGLGFEVTNIWLYYGTCMLIAILFLNIVEFLIVTFGDIGKFAALIILILQLAATGGTFPIETVPQGFQKIYNFLPMTYTIKLIKESLVCIDSNLLQKNLIIVLILAIVFILINGVNDVIRKKKENKE